MKKLSLFVIIPLLLGGCFLEDLKPSRSVSIYNKVDKTIVSTIGNVSTVVIENDNGIEKIIVWAIDGGDIARSRNHFEFFAKDYYYIIKDSRFEDEKN